ncbi:hypothetical protein VMCG_03322 [Cytospora schulzeri]|uniref:NADH dehydrogenase [ubiquinone] 1 beta subcomplex subunit 11, mitochondrial n=1 Tax=Cytospora schulzeri TaxID=448051 RepID=A0A423WXH6_9PEZI|nr:hypothetical protein VMCG_03322 [Valsa malicola]
MRVLRPSAAGALSRAINNTPSTQTTIITTTRRAFSASQRRASGGGHGPEYDPPTGWLFGVRPGEKAEKEGWENMAYYGFGGSLVLVGVAYAFKPDTSIQTWALEEARRRLEAEGILEDPDKKN